jgi:hypothetical protein
VGEQGAMINAHENELKKPTTRIKDVKGYESYSGLGYEYFEDLLSKHNKVVCAEPCGSGKTLAMIEYMAKSHQELGFLYVRPTIESLEFVRKMLVDLGVDERVIQVYTHETAAYIKRGSLWVSDILLVTHIRMLIDMPSDFIYRKYPFEIENEKELIKRVLVIDESLPPVTMAEMSAAMADSILKEVGLQLGVKLTSGEEIDKTLKALSKVRKLHAYAKSRPKVKVKEYVLNSTLDLATHKSSDEMRHYQLMMMFYQIIRGRYKFYDNDCILLYVPMTVQEWMLQKLMTGRLSVRELSRLHRDYDMEKALKSVRQLVYNFPELDRWLEVDSSSPENDIILKVRSQPGDEVLRILEREKRE